MPQPWDGLVIAAPIFRGDAPGLVPAAAESDAAFLNADGVWTVPAGGPGGNPDWADILNKPSTFTPNAHTHVAADITDLPPAGSALDAWPVGSVFLAVVSTSPTTLLGGGTWAAFGAGRVLIGRDASDVDFDTAEETGGAKTVAATGANASVSAGTPAGTNSAPTFTGSALGTHTHTFTGNALGTHQHELPIQNVSGTVERFTAAATFGTGTSRAAVSQVTTTANTTSAAVALSQAISAGTPAGTNAAITAGTPAGTVSAPTFTGSALGTHTHAFTGSASSIVQPYIVVFMWKRTA